MPKDESTPIHDWQHARHARHGLGGLLLKDVFVSEAFSGTREDPTLRRDRGPLYAFTMQGLYAAAWRRWRWASPAPCSTPSSSSPPTRRRAIWRGWPTIPTVQSDVARREAITRLGACLAGRDPEGRATGGPTMSSRSARPNRARVRLGCSQAIHQLAESPPTAVYKAAGTSAIFLGTPFERRFRDIHTLSQQIQSREAHFETVGRILFNGDPDGTFM